MSNSQDYNGLMTDIIAKQSIILGPKIALTKARTVSGLTVDDSGVVTKISGNGDTVVKNLIDVYVELSGEIVKTAMHSVFEGYPHLKK